MAADGEQEAKRRKVDGEDVKKEEPEPAKELEQDDPADKRAQIKEPIAFDLHDATLNVIQAHGGRLLVPLSDGGLQYLVGGARANTGIKQGRYFFEVMIFELLIPTEPASGYRNVPTPRQQVRVGFATKDSSLFLGSTEDSVCFDTEGFFTASKVREPKAQVFGRHQIVGVLLNLNKKSPNADTISLFRDGQRVSAPMPLPQNLKGKPLFPCVNFKNASVMVNWGPTPISSLPFSCRTMATMAEKDAERSAVKAPKDGKYEAVFPVGIPDEGTFDWLDSFLAKNPQYAELSDRAILRWAENSGMVSNSAHTWKNSLDKPEMHFGIPMMDDFSVRRVLNAVVATQPRNYVVMEVKANLVASERTDLMKRFNGPTYKKVANVVMGEPPADFKTKHVLEPMLKEKKEKTEKDWKNQKAEKEKKKLFEIQQKQLEAARKKRDEELAQQKVKEEAAAGDAQPEAALSQMKDVKEEAKEEVKEEVKEEKEDVKEEEVKKEEEDEDEPPLVELTAEEKAMWFRKKASPDLASWVLAPQLAKLSLPGKEDGFDEVRYEWQKEDACKDYFKKWVIKQKIMCRVEELQAGEWFKTKWAEWQKLLAEWHQAQTDFQDPVKQEAKKAAAAAEVKQKAAEEEAKKAEEAKKKAEAEGEAAKPEEKPEGEKAEEAADGEKKEEKKEDQKPEAEAEKKPEEEKAEEGADKPKAKPVVDDIFAVENVCDIGDGEPLFSNFTFEDWALLSLRLELYLMAGSFTKDVGDPDRGGIHESHIAFYYNKYYRKTWNVKYYGVETNVELVQLVKNAVQVAVDTGVLKTDLSDDMPFDMLVKLTEEARRARERLLDAGDETVKLKFQKPGEVPAGSYQGQGQSQASMIQSGQSYHHGGKSSWQQQSYQGKGSYGGKAPVIGGGYGKGYSQGPYGKSGGYGKGYGKDSKGGSKGTCRHWQMGNCTYGDNCRYSHT